MDCLCVPFLHSSWLIFFAHFQFILNRITLIQYFHNSILKLIICATEKPPIINRHRCVFSLFNRVFFYFHNFVIIFCIYLFINLAYINTFLCLSHRQMMSLICIGERCLVYLLHMFSLFESIHFAHYMHTWIWCKHTHMFSPPFKFQCMEFSYTNPFTLMSFDRWCLSDYTSLILLLVNEAHFTSAIQQQMASFQVRKIFKKFSSGNFIQIKKM